MWEGVTSWLGVGDAEAAKQQAMDRTTSGEARVSKAWVMAYPCSPHTLHRRALLCVLALPSVAKPDLIRSSAWPRIAFQPSSASLLWRVSSVSSVAIHLSRHLRGLTTWCYLARRGSRGRRRAEVRGRRWTKLRGARGTVEYVRATLYPHTHPHRTSLHAMLWPIHGATAAACVGEALC